MLYWIWLTKLKGVGPVRQRILLEKFINPKNIYKATIEEILECEGIGLAIAKTIVGEKSLEEAKLILEEANKFNINLLTLNDPLYPQGAKLVDKMPILLYYKGKLINDSMGVAIVGSRRCSEYGKIVVDEAARYLAKEKIVLVSGMAKGIDGYAHTSCIKAGGYTIAVLGNGLDICYPPEHKELMKEIIKNGAIISEYPPGVKPNPKNFPKRNLIITAWSEKILVIEAGEKSGSLITADYGRQLGREVLALPDNIYNRESIGSNKLILEGSKIFLYKEQLLIQNRYESKEKVEKLPLNPTTMDKFEEAIIGVLKKKSTTIEELSGLLNISQMDLLGRVSMMELEGKLIVQGSTIRLP